MSDNYEIEIPNLPNLYLLLNEVEDLEEICLREDGIPPGNFFDDPEYVSPESNSYRVQRAIVKDLAENITYRTIDALANFFNLDSSYKQDLPFVQVVDPKLFSNWIWSMRHAINDAYDPTPFFVGRNSFFRTFCRSNYYDEWQETKSPVIGLYLGNLDIPSIVEEAVHFLEWNYSNGEIEKNLGLKGVLRTIEIKGSSIIRARIEEVTDEDALSDAILSESIAEFTRLVTGVSVEKTSYETLEKSHEEHNISGIPKDKNPYELLETLCEQGPNNCYRQLLDWNNCNYFDELCKKNHFSWLMGGSFPSEFVHFIGYGLGGNLHKVIKNKNHFNAFSKEVFGLRDNANQRLDKITCLYRAIC